MGCFSVEAYKFIDFLAASGQSCWQILPLSPTGHGEPCDSPYKAYSAFAGNPYYIDLQALIEDGALTQEECDAIDWGSDPSTVDYDKMDEHRIKLLRTAYDRTDLSTHPDFVRFCADNAWWLDDYALFMSLKDFFGDIPSARTTPGGWMTTPCSCPSRISSAISLTRNGPRISACAGASPWITITNIYTSI